MEHEDIHIGQTLLLSVPLQDPIPCEVVGLGPPDGWKPARVQVMVDGEPIRVNVHLSRLSAR